MKALEYLPPSLATAARGLGEVGGRVCEIRIRRGMAMAFSTYDTTVFVNTSGRVCKLSAAVVCGDDDIKYAVNRLCAGAVYRCADALRRGYIVTPEGLRAGICGEAVYEDGRLCVVDNYTSLNLRIPHTHRGCAEPLLRTVLADGPRSMLIFSPPSVGKTTLIRELAVKLSLKYRVAVVDEKGEILPRGMCGDCGMCDILRGYSKPDGMELAVRMLSPQVIICDEIGMADDIPSILSVQNSGVPLIATAHAADMRRLMLKPNLRALCEAGVFEFFIRLEKGDEGMKVIVEGGENGN